MQSPAFIELKTSDGLTLPGLLYEAKRAKKAAIFLHGNGSSSVFYDREINSAVAAALARKGISYLTFNNRGAGLVKKLTIGGERKLSGMAFEKIKECVPDINAAVKFLRQRGYNEFYLIGHSTGANKICVYDHYQKRNPIKKYILLAGGDDTGIYYNQIGKKKFRKLLAKAKQKIKRRQAEEIIPELLPKPLFSYGAFYDIANPDGDYNCFPFLEACRKVKISTKQLFRFFKALKKPTLVIYGKNDEYGWGDVPRCVDVLRQQRPDMDYKIIPGANHMFIGREKHLAATIARWL
jgi:pimeloyl-ACP methyl ester carboxylesterase